jgi:hypothetical protein
VVASGKAERYLVQIGAYSTTLNAKRAQGLSVSQAIDAVLADRGQA